MNVLPPEFSSLNHFVEKWAKPTENLRTEQRINSSKGEFMEFYENTLPFLDEILEYLSRYPLGTLSGNDLTLYHFALAFAEMAPHAELYKGSADVPFSFEASRFVTIHGDQVDS